MRRHQGLPIGFIVLFMVVALVGVPVLYYLFKS